ncbi:Voltage-dependent calcium channel subunit alpha-2/delta-1 [Nymphon striatum]|nr:Voltage-dependent calcium channel subunit alpha-2/delta-1 [Nymphon striatum]
MQKLVEHAEKIVKNYSYDDNIKLGDVQWVNSKDFSEEDPKLTFNETFKQPVNFNFSAVHLPVEVYEGYAEVQNGLKWSVQLDKAFKENFKNDPTLLWQFFGSQVGYMRTYPALKWNNDPNIPDLYDVRRRSWYIRGSSSPKDMLILIDTSGSVHGQTLEIMKIAFNDKATWISCFDTFVQANKWHKKMLRDAVDKISDGGIANFDVGLEFAFKQFKKFQRLKLPQEGAECHKLIMLFTDGGVHKPNNTLLKYNKDIKIRIFTYSVSVQAIPFAGVKWIACQSKGYFSNIIGIGAVRESIQRYVPVISKSPAPGQVDDFYPSWVGAYPDSGDYVEVLSRPQALARKETYRWSNFYFDAMDNQTLVGVMGVDSPIKEMTDLIPRMKIGPFGYSFSINENGFIVFHPGIKPEYGYLEEPPDINFLDLEHSSPAKIRVFFVVDIFLIILKNASHFTYLSNSFIKQLRKYMIDRKSGSSVIKDFIKTSNDYHVAELEMKYFYMPVGNTAFRLALAIPTSKTHYLKVYDYGGFKVHDEIPIDSSIVIAPWIECDIIKENYTIADILTAFNQEFRNAAENCNSDILGHLLWDVNKTTDVYKYWAGNTYNRSGIIAQFVGTEGGITRFYPDSQMELMEKEKDTWNSAYFKRTMLGDEKSWTFSFPTQNRFAESVAIVASHPITVKYSNIPYKPAVISVKLDAELLYSKMMALESTNYRFACSEIDSVQCYILDDGGIVIATNEINWEGKVGFHLEAINLPLYHLLDNNIYEREKEYDFQAKCKRLMDVVDAAPRLSNIFADIISTFNFQWLMDGVWCLIQRFETTGSCQDLPRPERPRSVCIVESSQIVEAAHSPTKSTRRASIELGISQRSIVRMLHNAHLRPRTQDRALPIDSCVKAVLFGYTKMAGGWLLCLTFQVHSRYQMKEYLLSFFSFMWLHTASAQTVSKDETELYHRCITKSSRYMYGRNFAYSEKSPDISSNCTRWFKVSKIKNTNLIFVMSNHDCNSYEDQESLQMYHIPFEVVLCSFMKENCFSDPKDPNFCEQKLLYRKRPEQCFNHDARLHQFIFVCANVPHELIAKAIFEGKL